MNSLVEKMKNVESNFNQMNELLKKYKIRPIWYIFYTGCLLYFSREILGRVWKVDVLGWPTLPATVDIIKSIGLNMWSGILFQHLFIVTMTTFMCVAVFQWVNGPLNQKGWLKVIFFNMPIPLIMLMSLLVELMHDFVLNVLFVLTTALTILLLPEGFYKTIGKVIRKIVH